ncbi:uncharacterized protein Z520_00483 [Fonsecaea multimorphosa CBS 102226]|uniref:Uncharacterized protein n=1 Tax=Fonsecaea multimorphosa CBS 102226 TaxID=1442371 RepID=A0A0D2J2X7_9EURO|nr:uncharacterized protein Z520_00483 [Fonsecaea multimorphosa CBS 102226]KIY03792.1 hypothetical protein Z520_00483 [Fonsecaea multimorphosa CBS 102226]OAL32484.1 hypothetical protein AYO22_00506 [Fonsecaea multimorphosa]
MGFWPFGGGKKGRATQAEDQGRNSLLEKTRTDLRARRNTSSSQEFVTMGRTASQRGQDEKPRRLSKQRLPSHPENVPRASTLPMSVPGPESLGYKKGSYGGFQSTDIYSHNPMSQTSIGPEEFTALPQAPTLLAKRPGYDPTLHRRKSSKRKAEDYAREREVRAMSSPIQILKRPSTYSGSGPLRRDTKQIPGDLNRRLQRPTSEVSLPLPETIQESEDLSNQASFKIGILAALSPRPTLTYVASPRPSAGKQPARVKPSVQQAIEEEDPSSKKRINELADELDAGGLRELMERDRRRKERKKEADRARLERKLQRKADRQREEEMRGRRANDASGDLTVPGQDTERRGRALFGNVGESSHTAVARRPPSPEHQATNPFADPGSSQAMPVQHIRNPFEDEKDIDPTQESFLHEGDEEEEGPPVPVRSPLRTVPAAQVRTEEKASQAVTISPPISPAQGPVDRQSLSQTSGLAREITPDIPEYGSLDRRASDQSNQQLSSWTSFFRRGGRRKASNVERGRSTPSEFSNTSRESFAARKQQPPPVMVPRTFRRSDSSSVPQRTMSKFREDLPELPISPPDSRVQSPEVMTSPQAGQASRQPRHSLSGTLDNRSLATSSSNAALDRGATEGRHPQGVDIEMGGTTSGHGMSQSLASVDSEGSWLSGKPPKRLSGGMSHPLRQSQSSIPPQSIPGSFEPEDDDLANDEYLNKLSPGPSGRRDSAASAGRRASSNVIDLERERQQSPVPDLPQTSAAQGEDEKWHAGVARQATVIRQPHRARSKEGLLKETGKDDLGASRRASTDVEDEGELVEGEPAGTDLQETTLLRARSVDYKGHAKHISAGSARLLDIRRSSTQSESAPRSGSLPQIVPPAQREQQPIVPPTE